MPPEPSEMPRNPEPVRLRLPPKLRLDVIEAICGCQELEKPSPTSYSAVLVRTMSILLLEPSPPTTSTFPSGNRLAVCNATAVSSPPVGSQIPVDGSYN